MQKSGTQQVRVEPAKIPIAKSLKPARCQLRVAYLLFGGDDEPLRSKKLAGTCASVPKEVAILHRKWSRSRLMLYLRKGRSPEHEPAGSNPLSGGLPEAVLVSPDIFDALGPFLG